MTIQIIRPNGNISNAGQWNTTGGAVTVHGALGDNSTGTGVQSLKLNTPVEVSLGTYTVPAGSMVSRFRVGITLTMSGANAKVITTGKIGARSSQQTSTAAGTNVTRYGPWNAGAPLTQTNIDAASITINDRSGSFGNQIIKDVWIELDVSPAPTVTVTAPGEGSTTPAGRPTVVWDYVSTNNDPQAQADIAIVPSSVYGAGGFNAATEFEDFDDFLQNDVTPNGGMGTSIFGTDSSWAPSASQYPLLAPGVYRAYVRPRALTPGGYYHPGALDFNQFTVAYNTPPTPTVVVGTPNGQGPLLTVSGAAAAANLSNMLLRVQRTEDNGITWFDLPSGYATPNFAGAWSSTFRDRQAAAGVATKYRAQVLGRDTANNVWVNGQFSAQVSNTLSLTDAATQGWTFWTWVRTAVVQLGAPTFDDGPTYETGTWTTREALVADGPHDWTEAPAEELVAHPLGRDRAVVVSGPLAGAEGDFTFLLDPYDTTHTEAELEGLVNSQASVLIRKPGLSSRWVRWVGERAWAYSEEFSEVTVAFVEVSSPAATEA